MDANGYVQCLLGADSTTFARDQACNECRRRKGRCDKALPECGPCQRNKRHCLYERHSKKPLTRKYLTEVEEELQKWQNLALRHEKRADEAEARLRRLGNAGSLSMQVSTVSPQDATTVSTIVAGTDESETFAEEHSPPNPLEAPPSGPAGFSWDEQSQDTSQLSLGEEERAVDGMASLTVDESEAGYLGVASGAALLRLLLPDAQKKPPTAASAGRPRDPSFTHSTTHTSGLQDHWLETPLWDSLNIGQIDLDSAIDAYFRLFHQSYPIVHEATFRAQYTQVIPRPSGRSWHALAFMIAALGVFTTGTSASGSGVTDRNLFTAAKSNISIESLETGNMTLVQTLTLMSNYLQKRNKPNSGYNYLGLALNMAMGLGLHKEFHDWDISPLNMEVRRRVWWCMFVFNVGASITFGRPLSWPKNVEVSLPLNVSDRILTNVSSVVPLEVDQATTYSALIMQARFHTLTNEIYTRVISMPFPSATELLRLDDSLIGQWQSSVPPWYHESARIAPMYAMGHGIMWWRLRNFRIIMYRHYVIRRALQARTRTSTEPEHVPPAVQEACARCSREANLSISAISHFWASHPKTRMAAWYALYFLFQAALIPCVCLRNSPTSPEAHSWRAQITQTLATIQLIAPVNPSGVECYCVIQRLCGPFLQGTRSSGDAGDQDTSVAQGGGFVGYPTEESPQTQIENVSGMIWPNANPNEMDFLMQEGGWDDFLSGMEESLTGPSRDGAGVEWE